MVYKRKRSVSKRRGYKKRKMLRKRVSRSLALSRSRFNTHVYKRYGSPEHNVFVGDGVWTYQTDAINFSMGDVISRAELTQLYDSYKIMAVVVKLTLVNNPNAYHMNAQDVGSGSVSAVPGQTNLTPIFPKLWYYRDYDDSSPPSTLNEFREIGRVKCFTMVPNRTYSFKIKPAIRVDSATQSTMTRFSPRLDCDITSTVHYGFKYALDLNGTKSVANIEWIIQAEKLYYLKMYNSR